jgi:hypothetical protein
MEERRAHRLERPFFATDSREFHDGEARISVKALQCKGASVAVGDFAAPEQPRLSSEEVRAGFRSLGAAEL